MLNKFLYLVVGLILCGGRAHADQAVPVHKLSVLSNVFTIDRLYTSMSGPSSDNMVSFVDAKHPAPRLLWLVGFKAQIIDPATQAPISTRYFCHNTLQFDQNIGLHSRNPALGQWNSSDFKLASLIQGRTQIDLPKGFGIPIESTDILSSTSMVLNSKPNVKPFKVQVKMTYSYVQDKDLKAPLKPLVRRAIILWVPLSEAKAAGGECCILPKKGQKHMVMQAAQPVPTTKDDIRFDKDGQKVLYHWMVPPGRHQYRYFLGKGLRGIGYPTTVHYIAIHLHPYGVYCQLKDLTTGKIIFKGRAWTDKGLNVITKIQSYSSVKGVKIFPDHAYEISCEYNNTTNHDVDAMALMYFYYLSKEFNERQVIR